VITLKKLKSTFILIIIVCILLLVYFYVSVKPPQEPPDITIIINDKQIEYVVGKNEWNGAKYDREDTFKTILKNESDGELPYIELGSTAEVKFSKNPPSKITISDIYIDDSGNQIYTDKEIINIPVKLKNGKASFEINMHYASGLSSYYVEDKIVIRGFRIVASWGNNECEYAFIIRTD
jgi:hypothetical protein